MYNLWWIVIALGVIIITGIVIWACVYCSRTANFDTLGSVSIFISFLAGIVFVVMLAISIALPLQAKKEYNEFIETQTMVEQVYNGGEYTDLENAGLNNAIIEVNKWLTNARASVKQFGNWSMYYALDLDSLDYIKLVKGEKNG